LTTRLPLYFAVFIISSTVIVISFRVSTVIISVTVVVVVIIVVIVITVILIGAINVVAASSGQALAANSPFRMIVVLGIIDYSFATVFAVFIVSNTVIVISFRVGTVIVSITVIVVIVVIIILAVIVAVILIGAINVVAASSGRALAVKSPFRTSVVLGIIDYSFVTVFAVFIVSNTVIVISFGVGTVIISITVIVVIIIIVACIFIGAIIPKRENDAIRVS
jgi:hypothetical protein